MDLKHTEFLRGYSPFVKHLGLDVLKLENGTSQLSLKIKDYLKNSHEAVHGGVIYSLADIAMGVAVYSTLKKEQTSATIEIKINYLKPARAAVLICDARIVQKGNNIAVLEAEVRADDILIAKAMGTFSIFKSKDEKAIETL